MPFKPTAAKEAFGQNNLVIWLRNVDLAGF